MEQKDQMTARLHAPTRRGLIPESARDPPSRCNGAAESSPIKERAQINPLETTIRLHAHAETRS